MVYRVNRILLLLSLPVLAFVLSSSSAQYTVQAVQPAQAAQAAQTAPGGQSGQTGQTGQTVASTQSDGLSVTEWSRISRELSEDGGYFRSDNFTSNETPYLQVVDKLRELGATGGAYLGVGPEQNFTYIAKIRPKIAVLFDIRRQAVIQHLMYKAIFHHSPTRAQFLSLLLSRPIPKEKIAAVEATPADLVAFFDAAPADEKAYTANLALIRKTIVEDFQYPLTASDVGRLEYVYKTFRTEGLEIAFRIDSFGDPGRGGYFPALKDLILQTDLNGKLGNFLAIKDDYEFVRALHRKNMILLVVGDFGGTKALAAVADYLKKNSYTVTAFYTSNVEQYLFESGVFEAFVNNVRKFPITDKSLFIRSASGRFAHPARLPGHRSATLLQKMTVFLKDFEDGRYQNHYDLVTTNYIAPEK